MDPAWFGPEFARPAPALSALFPAGVAAAEIALSPGAGLPTAASALLTGEEWGCIRHCAAPRVRDFTAGRLCARRAAEQLGLALASLLPGSDRQPRWPAVLAGSITHTDGYGAAVVGRTSAVRSLGLDAEAIGAVRAPVHKKICVPLERRRLGVLDPTRLPFAATLTFAAKEAFFKCQFPLAREWLGFDAVAVRVADWNADAGEFRIEPMRRLALHEHCPPAADGWEGRFRRQDGLIVAGMALAAS